MKLIAVIAITLLVVLAHGMSEVEVQDTVQRMEKSKYGKTLLATIALQMEAEGPVEDLIRLLQTTEDDLRAEQSQEDDAIYALQEQCDVDLVNLQAEIKAASQRIEVLTRELGEKIPVRDEKQTESNRKQQFRSLINQKVDELDANKALKDQEWAEESRQHDEAMAVIEKAKQLIVEALKSSFLQRADKTSAAFAQVTQHFVKHSKSNFKRKSWNTIFKLLSQITSYAPVQADQSGVDRVIGLCDELLEKIAASREIERKDYEHWVNEYQTTRDELVAKVEELTGEINQLDSEVDTLTKRINEATNERNDQTVRRDQKQQEHDDRLTYCDEENRNYSERRQSRSDELEVVSDAIALLQSNLRLFRQYVAQRTESVQRPQ